MLKITLKNSPASILLAALSGSTIAAPITYTLNPDYQNLTEFDYGLYTSPWSMSGTITTDGEAAPAGTAVGADPGYLRDSHNDFLSYDITLTNVDAGLNYIFASDTPLNVTDDGNGIWYSGSAPTYAWADSTGDLLLGSMGFRNNLNHPNGAYLTLSTNGVFLYDYALNNYVFGSTQLATGSPYTYTVASTNFDATAVPEPGTLALAAFGLAGIGVTWRRRSKV